MNQADVILLADEVDRLRAEVDTQRDITMRLVDVNCELIDRIKRLENKQSHYATQETMQ